MEKEISFLHDELKSKNTVINLLLETLVKYKDEKKNIQSNHDLGNIQPGKNIKTTKSVETKEGEITSGEQLNMTPNEGNHLNNTPPYKSNHVDSSKQISDRNISANHTSQNEDGINNKKRTLIIGDSIVKNIEGWRLNKRL